MTKIQSLTDLPAVRDYLNRVEAEPRSLKTAVVRHTQGKYWTDVAVIRFGTAGEVHCTTLEHAPTESEQSAISHEWARADFPKINRLERLTKKPDMMKNAKPEDVLEFRTPNGKEIIMVQVRVERELPEGTKEKNYVPWTFWGCRS